MTTPQIVPSNNLVKVSFKGKTSSTSIQQIEFAHSWSEEILMSPSVLPVRGELVTLKKGNKGVVGTVKYISQDIDLETGETSYDVMLEGLTRYTD